MSTYTVSNISSPDEQAVWSKGGLFLFRFFFIYFLIQVIPLDWKFYRDAFTDIRPGDFLYWLQLTRYYPRFIADDPSNAWGLISYANWLVAALMALVGALVWSRVDKTRRQGYHYLYYVLRVVLRYRLAIAMIAYGLFKLVALQIPKPTLSDFNTAYGDFLLWKAYYHTMGQGGAFYEQSLGFFELLGGVLLLWRRTTTIACILLSLMLTNIVLANFAYLLGDHIFSTYLLVIALFLLAHDVPRLYNLVSLNRFTRAAKPLPVQSARCRRTEQWSRAVLLVFGFGFFALTLYASGKDHWPYKQTAGLRDAAGYYNVEAFVWNGNNIPSGLSDPSRWQNVVFEPWNTISIRTAGTVAAEPHQFYPLPNYANYEASGNRGRQFFNYTVDESRQQLRLNNLNGPVQTYHLTVKRPDAQTIILRGTDANNDSLYALLKRQDKKYLLLEGRRNVDRKF